MRDGVVCSIGHTARERSCPAEEDCLVFVRSDGFAWLVGDASTRSLHHVPRVETIVRIRCGIFGGNPSSLGKYRLPSSNDFPKIPLKCELS